MCWPGVCSSSLVHYTSNEMKKTGLACLASGLEGTVFMVWGRNMHEKAASRHIDRPEGGGGWNRHTCTSVRKAVAQTIILCLAWGRGEAACTFCLRARSCHWLTSQEERAISLQLPLWKEGTWIHTLCLAPIALPHCLTLPHPTTPYTCSSCAFLPHAGSKLCFGGSWQQRHCMGGSGSDVGHRMCGQHLCLPGQAGRLSSCCGGT